MENQPRSPKEILRQARDQQAAERATGAADAQRALEQGLTRRQELQKTIADSDQAGWKAAIQEAQTDIKAATDAGQLAPEALQRALVELQQGQEAMAASLTAARAELAQLEGRADIQAHDQKEREQAAAQAQRAQKVEELDALEQEMNEVLRLEQEVNGTARLLTELWKQDNHWALGFKSDGDLGSTKDSRALAQQVEAISQAKVQLQALEGKWFKGDQKRKLQASIAQEPAIRQQQEELLAKQHALYQESERLQDELQPKLAALYSALDKIQERQNEIYNSQARREAPYGPREYDGEQDRERKVQERQRWFKQNPGPPDAENLLRAKLPFVSTMRERGKRFDVNLRELFKKYGYTRQ